jgi:HlyD family secretion protein
MFSPKQVPSLVPWRKPTVRLAGPLALILLAACSGDPEADAYGNFEAEEVVVAAESPGRLLQLDALEGRTLEAGAVVGLVDTTQLALERDQLSAQRRALYGQRAEAEAQRTALGAQLEIAERTWARTQRLADGGAATSSQRDASERETRVLRAQVVAADAGLRRIAAELLALDVRRAAVNDRVRRAQVTNPVRGTVLALHARAGEHVAPGQPLYTVADLDTLTLRAYISADQLASITLGDRVTVRVDGAAGALVEHAGVVSWISERAEFTPTPVQTRDERADLVYAVKVRVANSDGSLKVGMPADVSFGARVAADEP